MARTGATFADAAAEFLRYVAQDRQRKPSTRLSRWHRLPAFGAMRLEDLTTEHVERWLRTPAGWPAVESLQGQGRDDLAR